MILFLRNPFFSFTLFCFSHLYFPIRCLLSVSPSIFLFLDSLSVVTFVHLSIHLVHSYRAPSSVKLCFGQRQDPYLHLERMQSNVAVPGNVMSRDRMSEHRIPACIYHVDISIKMLKYLNHGTKLMAKDSWKTLVLNRDFKSAMGEKRDFWCTK